ncbi:MAG: hypothetical protein A2X49_04490 [Lentisphaerae bacterium GWF2_52_8]|nr:MAG: hypothetical protein A2X49_04490 [Lentisphaerae bacterium GWF2_52_8]
MNCRPACAACCIAPSISAKIPGTPGGKAAGIPCPHLTAELRCELFGKSERPAVCSGFRPSPETCGKNREEALSILSELELSTAPKN